MAGDLETREAFLRAIFDAPDDDTPRLVYADWLDENGNPDFAAFIRMACEYARIPSEDTERRGRLAAEGLNLMRAAGRPGEGIFHRGFVQEFEVSIDAALLADVALSADAAAEHPGWFGSTRLRITGGLIAGAVQVDTLMSAPATANVTVLDLIGIWTDAPAGSGPVVVGEYRLIDADARPVITVLGVEALANHRGARRITELTLTNNNLDNDAARFLVRSPYLIRLKRLDIQQGNSLQGRTWAQLLERFGEAVVS